MLPYPCFAEGARRWPMTNTTKATLNRSICSVVAVSSNSSSRIDSTSLKLGPGRPSTDQRKWTPSLVVSTFGSRTSYSPAGIPNTVPTSFSSVAISNNLDRTSILRTGSKRLSRHLLSLRFTFVIQGICSRPSNPIPCTKLCLNSDKRETTAWIAFGEQRLVKQLLAEAASSLSSGDVASSLALEGFGTWPGADALGRLARPEEEGKTGIQLSGLSVAMAVTLGIRCEGRRAVVNRICEMAP